MVIYPGRELPHVRGNAATDTDLIGWGQAVSPALVNLS